MEKELMTNEKLISVKELADVLNVGESSVKRTLEKLRPVLGSVLRNNQGGYLFNEEQATLIKQEIQGHHNLQSRQIDNVSTDYEMELMTQKVLAYHMQKSEKLLAEKKQLELENKQLQIEVNEAEKKVEFIMQKEKEFHSLNYSASQIANHLGTTSKNVGIIARTIGLTIKDEYGNTVPAIGRNDVTVIQVKCIDGNYRNSIVYSESAKNLIEAYYMGNKDKINKRNKRKNNNRNKKVTYTII